MCLGKNKNIIIITKCEIFLLLYISLMNSFFLISKELHIYYSFFKKRLTILSKEIG